MSGARASPSFGLAPLSLDQLKQISQKRVNTPVQEFSIKSWIHSARDAFASADDKWAAAQRGSAQSQRELEEAYTEYRRATEIVQKLLTHPAFKSVQMNKSAEYFAYQELRQTVMSSQGNQKAIAALLEKRFNDWERTQRRHAVIRPSTSKLVDNSVPMSSQLSTSDLIDSYAVDSPPSSPLPSRERASSGSSAGEQPVNSIAERLAALRSTTGALSSNPPPPVAPKPSSLSSTAYGAPASQFGSTSQPLSAPSQFEPSNGVTPYRPLQSNYSPNVLSPSLKMPPTAAQRPGSAPSFDAFSQQPTQISYNDYSSRPSYTQPQLHSFHNTLSSSLPPSSQPGMSRTSGYTDLNQLGGASQHSFSPRPLIDYPSLRPAPAPPTNVKPHGHRPAPPPPISAPTRPAPIAPAPLRSNSGASLNLNGYSPAHSRAPTGLTFGDEAIGLTGLKNLGNTCYMNSTVQCLSATIPFAKYFKDGLYRKDVNTVNKLGTKGALADAVAELIRALWANEYLFLSPVTFRENICRFASQFRGSDQHDAQEFLGFLLDGLHEDLNYITRKPPPVEMSPEREHALETLPPQIMSEREWEIYRRRDDSFVVQCFQGQFRNQLKCLTCGQTSTTYNTFMPLSVPVPSGRNLKVSLMDCINTFVREEIMEKDEAWNCPKCKTKRKASKKLSLSRLPPILVIHLKRFSFKGPFSDKIETQVEYPLHGLDLTNFVPPPLMDQSRLNKPPKGWVYDLYAVTNHYGNLSSGHYTAYVRSQTKWNHIGDSKVTPIDPSVLQTPQAGKSSYVLYLRLR